MNFRFKYCNSKKSGNSEQRYAATHRVRPTKFRITGNELLFGFQIRPENQILDPREPFLQNWNRMFLISSVFALALDLLFFYIPVIDADKCLDSDNRTMIIAFLLRTVIDAFYIFHIILQFRTGYVIPSPRAFGREDLVNDPSCISRRYLRLYFFLDILAILPIPQVVVFLIIPTLNGPVALTTKESLKFIICGQYVPRIIRIYPRYKEVTRTSGILYETAWAGPAFNLLLYMLASHVFGTFWYLFSIDREVRCWHEV